MNLSISSRGAFPMRSRDRGWTWLLLLVALAAVACLIAPRLLTTKKLSYMPAPAGALLTINTAQEVYRTRYASYGALSDLERRNFIDPTLAQATTPASPKSGYYYILVVSGHSWSATALPVQPGTSGNSSYFIDETGVLRSAACNSDTDAPASAQSRVYEQ